MTPTVAETAPPLNVYLQRHGVATSTLDPFLLQLEQLGVPANEVFLTLEFVRTALTDPRAAHGLPPFDHPALRSTVAPPPRTFGQGLAGQAMPFLIDTVPAYPGHTNYKLGLVAGSGTTIGLLGIGHDSFEPGVNLLGLPLNVQVDGGRFFFLPGGGGQPGHTTWNVPIPTAMPQQSVYLQLFTLDWHAPFGLAASPGTELPIW